MGIAVLIEKILKMHKIAIIQYICDFIHYAFLSLSQRMT